MNAAAGPCVIYGMSSDPLPARGNHEGGAMVDGSADEVARLGGRPRGVEGDDLARTRRAFAEHLERDLDRWYGLAFAIVGDRGDAEEATHDAVCTALRGLGGLRDPERLDAWFGRILINASRDRLRRRRVRPLAVDLPEGMEARDRTADVGLVDALERALRDLSPDHRTAVLLRFWGELTVDEIANRTGAPPGTVKSRLHHALARLRAAWDAAAREHEVLP